MPMLRQEDDVTNVELWISHRGLHNCLLLEVNSALYALIVLKCLVMRRFQVLHVYNGRIFMGSLLASSKCKIMPRLLNKLLLLTYNQSWTSCSSIVQLSSRHLQIRNHICIGSIQVKKMQMVSSRKQFTIVH